MVERKSESTEKKVEETLASLPETENVVTQLDEQGDRIASNEQNVEDTERGFKLLESLVLIGIEHPMLERAIHTLVKDNPELAESDALIKLWESRGVYSAPNFVVHLMDSYSMNFRMTPMNFRMTPIVTGRSNMIPKINNRRLTLSFS